MDMETVIMEIIVNSGDARSKALEAVKTARRKEFAEARKMLAECDESMNKTHEIQTELIQKEVRGENANVSLFLVHAQDHLMGALTVKDLAEQIIGILEEQAAK